MIVTVNHTIMDGQVARWYASEPSAERGLEQISASRNGVTGGDGAFLTPELFDAAWEAHERLSRGQDVRDIATHERAFGGDLTEL